MSYHEPDLSKIPAPLRGLFWQPMLPTLEWTDGSELLVAVPVCGNELITGEYWIYELAVVTIQCDEGYFKTICDRKTWECELTDADFYVLIRK